MTFPLFYQGIRRTSSHIPPPSFVFRVPLSRKNLSPPIFFLTANMRSHGSPRFYGPLFLPAKAPPFFSFYAQADSFPPALPLSPDNGSVSFLFLFLVTDIVEKEDSLLRFFFSTREKRGRFFPFPFPAVRGDSSALVNGPLPFPLAFNLPPPVKSDRTKLFFSLLSFFPFLLLGAACGGCGFPWESNSFLPSARSNSDSLYFLYFFLRGTREAGCTPILLFSDHLH